VPRPVRLRAVTPLEVFTVHLEFTDNTTTKDIDLKVYLHSPVFESLCKDLEVSRRSALAMTERRSAKRPQWRSHRSHVPELYSCEIYRVIATVRRNARTVFPTV
jgi:hypothetical protein